MIDPKYYGLVEMGFTGAVVLGFAFWQLYSVWGAGRPDGDASASKRAGVSEGDHETDKG